MQVEGSPSRCSTDHERVDNGKHAALDPADQVNPLVELFAQELLVEVARPAGGTDPRGDGSAGRLAEEVGSVLKDLVVLAL